MKLKTRLLLNSVGPMLLIIVIVLAMLAFEIPLFNTRASERGMKATAYAVAHALELIEGDYRINGGKMYKGDTVLSDEHSLLDSIKNDSGMDIAIFYSANGYASTIKDEEGRYLSQFEVDEEIADKVISLNEVYFDRDAIYAGVDYYGCYVPVKQNGTDSNIGMVFAGITQSEVKSNVTLWIVVSFAIVLAIAIAAFIYSGRYSGSLTKAIVECNKAADRLTSGELDIRLPENLVKRSDELGSLGRSNVKLATTLKDIVSEAKKCTTKEGRPLRKEVRRYG